MSFPRQTRPACEDAPAKYWNTRIPKGKDQEYTFEPKLNPPSKVSMGITIESTGYPGRRESTYESRPNLDDTMRELKETNPRALKKYENINPHMNPETAESILAKALKDETFDPDPFIPKFKHQQALKAKAGSSGYGYQPVERKKPVDPGPRHMARHAPKAVDAAPETTVQAASSEGLVLAADLILAGKPEYSFEPDLVAAPLKAAVAMRESVSSSGYGSGAYTPFTPATRLRGKLAAKKYGIDREAEATHKPVLYRSKFAKKLARRETAKRMAARGQVPADEPPAAGDED